MSSKKRILIVDDDLAMLTMLSELLEDEYDIALATNGKEGLERARAGGIDVVITGFTMWEMNGLEMAREIKASLPELPIIFQTGLPMNKEEIDSTGLAAKILLKPYSIRDIRQALTDIVSL